MPAGLSAKIPSVQNPRWLTEEYATSFFQSFCIRQARAPYTIPMIDRIPMVLTITGFLAESGSSGSEKRRKPYVPIFSSTLASTTDPAVGASVCASGSQVWNGNIGTLTAKPTKKAQNTHHCMAGGNLRAHQVGDIEAVGLELRVVLIVQGENAQEHEHAADQRVDHELDGRIAAPRPPQMAMMKYMGTSTVSQKTKKSRKSSAMKTPSMPVCKSRKNA